MADVFISYSNSDRDRIIPIIEMLEKEGWSVWWDRQIQAGKTFDEVIEKEINAAKSVVVIWTKNSVISRWVKTEASEGAQRNILVPILLDNVKVPFEFRRIQAVQLINWVGDAQDEGIAGLLDSLTAILGKASNASLGKIGGGETDQSSNIGDVSPVNNYVVVEQHKGIDEAANNTGQQTSADLIFSATARSRLLSFDKRLFNRPLVLISALLLLISSGGLFYVLQRKAKIESTQRGMILDQSGEPDRALALNQLDSNGNLVRKYPLDRAVSHLLGSEHGEPGLERVLFTASKSDVRLSIDSQLQEAVVEELRDRIGAVVVINPQTGDVLAMYSNPSYSLQEMQEDAEQWDVLQATSHFNPLLNRALGFNYTPGSTFNTVTMIAAYNAGFQHEQFICSGAGFQAEPTAQPIFDQDDPSVMHGRIGLDSAYKVSCNQYFAQLAVKLGPDRMAEAAKLVGITPYPNLEQATQGRRQPQLWNVSAQQIADAISPLESTIAVWPTMSTVDLSLLGYGQGHAGRVTPFQMALIASAIANLEGKLMKPKIEYDRPPEVWAQSTTPQNAAEMRRIMGRVITDRYETTMSAFQEVHRQGIMTGGNAGMALTEVPNYDPKTGQVKLEKKIARDTRGNPVREYMEPIMSGESRIDSWFLCIAPLKRPQIAIAVIIEGGGYGERAAASVAAALVMKAKEFKLL